MLLWAQPGLSRNLFPRWPSYCCSRREEQQDQRNVTDVTVGRYVNAVAHAHGEKQKADQEAVSSLEPKRSILEGCGLEAVAVALSPPSPVPDQQR